MKSAESTRPAPRRASWSGWLLVALAPWAAARAAAVDLAYVAIELPGAPAQLIPVELDGDPGPELAIVVAYTAWDELTVEETSELDPVAGLVAVLTIVPALLEHRELWIFDRQDDGTWAPLTGALTLDTDVLSLEATANPVMPLLALTDAGADAIGWRADGEGLERRQVVASPTALAATGAFLPRLRWTCDLDGDPWPDLLLPTTSGWEVFRGSADGFAPQSAQSLTLPAFDDLETPWRRDVPLPEVRDVDGDGLADLVAPHPVRGWNQFFVWRNLGGRLAPASGPLGRASEPENEDDSAPDVVFFDDLDGDGRAEYVTSQEIEAEEAGMKEMAHAKRPPHRYRVLDAGAEFSPPAEPRLEFLTDGYSFPDPSEISLPGGLWDLDGDGRRDLVTVTLDFSLLQAVRVLVAKSLNIGLDFHVLCQGADGAFVPVAGLDLSGRFKIDLDDFRQGQLSLFGGDFDGDGRKDFVQLGRGRKLSIHRGAAGCRFPAAPDFELELREAPQDLSLVEVADLDGDGLSDLAVTQPQAARQAGEAPSVRLDLYLSRRPQ
jgi:hypothetical protein